MWFWMLRKNELKSPFLRQMICFLKDQDRSEKLSTCFQRVFWFGRRMGFQEEEPFFVQHVMSSFLKFSFEKPVLAGVVFF